MEDFMEIFMIIIIVIGVCVVLPLLIIWLVNKRKSHEIDKKTEILKALLEKNPDFDPVEVMNKLNMSQRVPKMTLKQSLLDKLLGGCICLLVGVVIFFTHLYGMIYLGSKELGIVGGGVLAAVGIAYIIHYFVSKNVLRNELETEEMQLKEQ